ncbi:MAG: ABC transporter permease [Candidatus Phaeomarinobacter sp.]
MMADIMGQTGAILSVNIRGLADRKGLVAATLLCVALVVATLLGLDALSQGLRKTLAQSGDPNIALIMRGGSQAEINSSVSREQLDILLNAPGIGAASPEVNLIVDGFRRDDNVRANISLRGLTEPGIAMRDAVRLTEGRWPSVGSPELLIGVNIARTYRNMDVGGAIEFGEVSWKIVGQFETDGSVAESEIWADLAAVQNLFERGNTVQSVRIRVDGPQALSALMAYSENDPRLQLAVKSEAEYYAAQAARTGELVQYLAWPLALLMAVGAIVGAVNTMLASVASRTTEIATLRVIGFRRRAIFSGLIIECALICSVAGLIGAAIAYALLDGLTASTLAGGTTRIGYALQFSPSSVMQGIALAVLIGVFGAMIPATISSFRRVTANLTH